MPYTVKKQRKGKYAIVDKHTGRTVGHSSSRKKAQASARARQAGAHGWKPRRSK